MSAVDELERLMAAATQGPWFKRNAGVRATLSGGEVKLADCPVTFYAPAHSEHGGGHNDAALIVAMRNTLPALLAVARAAEAVRAIEREQTKADFLVDDWARLEAAWNALDAALAALGEAGK